MEHIKPQSDHFVEHGHEETDVNVKAILGFGVFLAISGIVLIGVLYGFYLLLDWNYERTQAAANPMIQPKNGPAPPHNVLAGGPESAEQAMTRLQQTFPEPRLQPNEYDDYAVYRKRQDDQLNAYTWINQADGSVRIPINRAMELIAQRGLPAVAPGWNPAANAAATAAVKKPAVKVKQ